MGTSSDGSPSTAILAASSVTGPAKRRSPTSATTRPSSPALTPLRTRTQSVAGAGRSTGSVSNTSAGPAPSLVVNDVVPALTPYVAASCTTSAGSCSESPAGTVRFDIGTLAGFGTATLTFQVTVGLAKREWNRRAKLCASPGEIPWQTRREGRWG